jgi:hypothetical protein
MSVLSRVRPARIASVAFDASACRLITAAAGDGLDVAYRHGPGLVLDVRPRASVGSVLRVGGAGGVLSIDSTTTPFAVATVLLALHDATGIRPRCRFPWPRHHWLTIVFGLTGVAVQVREILQRTEPDPRRRPIVQVGDD